MRRKRWRRKARKRTMRRKSKKEDLRGRGKGRGVGRVVVVVRGGGGGRCYQRGALPVSIEGVKDENNIARRREEQEERSDWWTLSWHQSGEEGEKCHAVGAKETVSERSVMPAWECRRGGDMRKRGLPFLGRCLWSAKGGT